MPARPPASHLTVTLLGTGYPLPRIDRFGPSTLVRAGDEILVFDCGRGASQRLWQLGIPLGDVTALFLTHLHSDHTVGIPDLWLTGWLAGPTGHRTEPFVVFGPPGTRAMMAHLEQAEAGTVFTRAKPRLAVYTHIVLLTTDARVAAPSIADLVARTRTTYAGPLEVGDDLTTIDIGDSVTVHSWAPSTRTSSTP